jgi:HEAT repeat protein
VTWGKQGNTINIPQVKAYRWHDDDRIRASVAFALGQLSAQNTVNDEVKQAIDCLGNLSQDPSNFVRKQAVQSLGKIPSELVIPQLQLALYDADMEVVAIASAAMERYKGYAVSSSEKNLPKNSALKVEMESR